MIYASVLMVAGRLTYVYAVDVVGPFRVND